MDKYQPSPYYEDVVPEAPAEQAVAEEPAPCLMVLDTLVRIEVTGLEGETLWKAIVVGSPDILDFQAALATVIEVADDDSVAALAAAGEILDNWDLDGPEVVVAGVQIGTVTVEAVDFIKMGVTSLG